MWGERYCLGIVCILLFFSCECFQPDEEFSLELSKVQTLDELCQYFPSDECEQMMNANETGMADGKEVVSGGQAEIAVFDACNPREMTITIPRHPDPDITVWPMCTRVMRCGGCCTSDVFSCEPTEGRTKYVRVFDTRLPYPGAHRFKFLGVRVVGVEEHTQCDAQCKTKPHECHKYQVYEARKCRCVCRHERLKLKSTCKGDQIWDDSECDCICPNRNTVTCPEPSYFSTTTCKCTLKTGVTGEIDLDKLFDQIDKGLIGPDIILNPESELDQNESDLESAGVTLDNDDEDGDNSTTTTPTTSSTSSTSTTTTVSTTTTTTTPKPTEDPCAHMSTKCWGSWKMVLLNNGRCACRPPFYRPP